MSVMLCPYAGNIFVYVAIDSGMLVLFSGMLMIPFCIFCMVENGKKIPSVKIPYLFF